jgi:hypothetical protein
MEELSREGKLKFFKARKGKRLAALTVKPVYDYAKQLVEKDNLVGTLSSFSEGTVLVPNDTAMKIYSHIEKLTDDVITNYVSSISLHRLDSKTFGNELSERFFGAHFRDEYETILNETVTKPYYELRFVCVRNPLVLNSKLEKSAELLYWFPEDTLIPQTDKNFFDVKKVFVNDQNPKEYKKIETPWKNGKYEQLLKLSDVPTGRVKIGYEYESLISRTELRAEVGAISLTEGFTVRFDYSDTDIKAVYVLNQSGTQNIEIETTHKKAAVIKINDLIMPDTGVVICWKL